MSKRLQRILVGKARPEVETKQIRITERSRIGSAVMRLLTGRVIRELSTLTERQAAARRLSGSARKRRRLTDGDFRRKARRFALRHTANLSPSRPEQTKRYPDQERIKKERRRGGVRHQHDYGEVLVNHTGSAIQRCDCGSLRFV